MSLKVQLSLDENLMERVDKYIDDHYLSRSGFFTEAAVQVLMKDDIWNALGSMKKAFDKIAESGNIDDDVLKQLEDFKAFCKMIGA